MNKLYLLLVCLTVLCACQTKQVKQESQVKEKETAIVLSAKVIQLRNELAKGMIEAQYVGFTGEESEQYKLYQKLSTTATQDELYTLTKDTNMTVATYATFGMIANDDTRFVDVFSYFLEGEQRVSTVKGCLMGEELVSSEIYQTYLSKVYKQRATDKILLRLDSFAIASNQADEFIYDNVFQNRKYTTAYLPVIEQSAFQHLNSHALAYIHQNYGKQYETQLITALKKAIVQKDVARNAYETLFSMMLFYDRKDMNQLLIEVLHDMERNMGVGLSLRYRKMLEQKGVL